MGLEMSLVEFVRKGRYRARLEAHAAQLGCQRVTFTGPVYGQDKVDLLMRADLFVLPTQNENFGLVVGEALAAGIPAIVTNGAPWKGLETEDCGWWIDHGVDPLLAALKTATSPPRLARKWVNADAHGSSEILDGTRLESRCFQHTSGLADPATDQIFCALNKLPVR
jgi:glycosyltransferase involved in cell wall biosynthesis